MKIYNVPPNLAAELIGVSPRTLANWRSADKRVLSWVKRGNSVFYNREELEKYAAGGVLYG